jgi:glutamyl-tRNA synthetase
LKDLEDLGYLPEAVVNWIALMGWSYDDRTEFFTMNDLIEKFSINHLNPAPASINFSKLDHFNGLHIRELPPGDLANRIKPFMEKAGYFVDEKKLLKIIPILRERLGGLDEAPNMAGFFFKEDVAPEPSELIGKKMTASESAAVLRKSIQVLEALDPFTVLEAEEKMRSLVEEVGLSAGQVFGILRAAVTGQTVSPPLFESMEIIGKTTVLERLRRAVETLDLLPGG